MAGHIFMVVVLVMLAVKLGLCVLLWRCIDLKTEDDLRRIDSFYEHRTTP